MSIVIRVIVDLLLAVGLFFTFIGVAGIIRMPDVFGRLQAATCIASLGNLCLMAGVIVYAILIQAHGVATYVKLALILLMILCTNPVSNHALCKAAYKLGALPRHKMVIDDYKEDDPE